MLRLRLWNIRSWIPHRITAVQLSPICTTGNGVVQLRQAHGAQSKGDKELVGFLSEEIVTETKGKKGTPTAKVIDGFTITTNEADVKLVKKFNNEEIILSLNVNHTVDTDPEQSEEGDVRGDKSQEQNIEMKSKPNFDIDIKKGNQTLSFNCSFLHDEHAADSQEEYNDVFLIEEITLYEGECKDETYAVAGDILDGYLYDLFMNMLEERGITNEFVEKLSEFCTDYEHELYVGMLRKLQGFFQTN
jgi:complement component 1 Q subcomponent-binding protein